MTFTQLVKTRYSVNAADFTNDTFWACFGYDDYTPDELHCTHKFFGDLTSESVEQIVHILDDHFKDTPFTPFTVAFTKEDFFGDEKDVRVLKPDWQKADKNEFQLGLRKLLDAFAEDRHPSYQPHVTTDLPMVNFPLTRYCLCQGDRILREYK